MYKISYRLHKSKKPFFDLNINGTYITCLYDTGATTAVWCSSKKLFEKVFPERILQDSKFSIGGFGGKNRILSDVFRVEGFKLGQVEFPHFTIVTQFDRNFGCDLILGSSLAVNADISIKHIKEQSINFEFEDLRYFSYFDVNENNNSIIEDSYVLSSEKEE